VGGQAVHEEGVETPSTDPDAREYCIRLCGPRPLPGVYRLALAGTGPNSQWGFDKEAVAQIAQLTGLPLGLLRCRGAHLIASGTLMTELVRTVAGDGPVEDACQVRGVRSAILQTSEELKKWVD